MIDIVSKFDRLQLSLNLAILRKDISAQQLVLLVVAGWYETSVYMCSAAQHVLYCYSLYGCSPFYGHKRSGHFDPLGVLFYFTDLVCSTI